MDSLPKSSHNCLTVPYTEILEHGLGKSIKYLESPLDLSRYTINSEGDLSLKIINVIGMNNSIVYNVGDQGVEYFIKEVEAAKAVMLEEEVVDWLLDRKPTIFDGKTLIIATEKEDA
jgi:hypothetical protein